MSLHYYHMEEGLRRKAASVKLIVTDVDGVLTDGGIIYDSNRAESKRFNVKDGFIVSHLKKQGILVGAITARQSKLVEMRCEELGFDFHYQGVRVKTEKMEEVLGIFELAWEEVAYIGDDLMDLPVLQRVGFSACPADALPYVRDKVDFVSALSGGQGVFREVADRVLEAKGILDQVIGKFILK